MRRRRRRRNVNAGSRENISADISAICVPLNIARLWRAAGALFGFGGLNGGFPQVCAVAFRPSRTANYCVLCAFISHWGDVGEEKAMVVDENNDNLSGFCRNIRQATLFCIPFPDSAVSDSEHDSLWRKRKWAVQDVADCDSVAAFHHNVFAIFINSDTGRQINALCRGCN